MKGYPFGEIEEKWRRRWEASGMYTTPTNPGGKFYMLEMFAYTSGDMHMGHFRNYILGDTIARQKMMEGCSVLHPFGWDAFGLPAEEAAIKHGDDPETWTLQNIARSRETLKAMGLSYDWDREVITCLPDYYRWTQWIFLVMQERGLAYQADALVNWCPHCQTVLANEQVVTGACWRCDTVVTKRELRQWFFRITDYAERLLRDLDRLEHWPENVKRMQRNWIGRSAGTEMSFEAEGNRERLSVFTTRADTLFGVTYIALGPESGLARSLSQGPEGTRVREFLERVLLKSEIERSAVQGEKEGVFTGHFAVHPLTGERVPIWIADYVVPTYGTGIVMGVPGHDQQDFAFAKKYGIPLRVVIQPPGHTLDPRKMEQAYVEPGIMVNSPGFDGLDTTEGIDGVSVALEAQGKGRRRVNYRLRDWLISRQRYWGAPIPMIHCRTCGAVPVPRENLPVLLPKGSIDYIPRGRSPLADSREFMQVTCPHCHEPALRDPDTMDTFVCSSWYYLRYVDPHNRAEAFSRQAAETWLPVDFYIGGVEHACGHLLYFRFVTKVLYDAGLLPIDEPTPILFNHGMVLDSQGDVMSKSKGNVISPAALMEQKGTDATRVAMYFAAPPERDLLWSDEGLIGATRFLNRVWSLITGLLREKGSSFRTSDLDEAGISLYRRLNRTIKVVTEDLRGMRFNTAISAMMEFLNDLESGSGLEVSLRRHCGERLTQLLAPFAPHLSEELWERMGHEESVFRSTWPRYDSGALEESEATLVVQVNGKVRSRVTMSSGANEEQVKQAALDDRRVQTWISGKAVKKVFVVPRRLVNIVTE